MNKTDLIKAIAEEAKTTQKDAAKVLDATVKAITDSLAKGEKVQFIGFGTFEVRERLARKGTNPSTKKEIIIPAKQVPAFKAGKALKEAVAIKDSKKGKKK
ncbi:MAG: HU family DNA-binding protein [Smithella sp.]